METYGHLDDSQALYLFLIQPLFNKSAILYYIIKIRFSRLNFLSSQNMETSCGPLFINTMVEKLLQEQTC